MSPSVAALVAQQAGAAADVQAEGTITIGIGCRFSLQSKHKPQTRNEHVRRSGVHRSVALALLLKQRGFMDACDATLAPHVIPVFRDLAGSDRAAAAADAMPKSRLVNAFVCKVCGGGGVAGAIVFVADIAARCVMPRAAA